MTTRSDYKFFPQTEKFRNQQEVPQEVPQEIPQEIPQENSEKHFDHTFTVITTLNSMEEGIKKLILCHCEVTDGYCGDIAEILKVIDTIKELDLPKNTKSSKKYKTAIDESAETVQKAKTTINNIVYYHDEMTHPDEVHEEYVLQLP